MDYQTVIFYIRTVCFALALEVPSFVDERTWSPERIYCHFLSWLSDQRPGLNAHADLHNLFVNGKSKSTPAGRRMLFQAASHPTSQLEPLEIRAQVYATFRSILTLFEVLVCFVTRMLLYLFDMCFSALCSKLKLTPTPQETRDTRSPTTRPRRRRSTRSPSRQKKADIASATLPSEKEEPSPLSSSSEDISSTEASDSDSEPIIEMKATTHLPLKKPVKSQPSKVPKKKPASKPASPRKPKTTTSHKSHDREPKVELKAPFGNDAPEDSSEQFTAEFQYAKQVLQDLAPETILTKMTLSPDRETIVYDQFGSSYLTDEQFFLEHPKAKNRAGLRNGTEFKVQRPSNLS